MLSKGFTRYALTKAASRLKFSSTFLNGWRIKAEPLCGAAFLLELWNNALRCSREVLRSCGAILPLMTAKKNFMLNRYAIQRRLRSHKEKVAKGLIHLNS